MAEFQEVMKQYNRMFEAHKKGVSIPVEASYETAVKQPDFFEKCVMEWAAEHPVVYPTWVEWLSKQGLVELKTGQFARQTANEYLYEVKTVATLNGNASKQIPEDIAQKLGIKPKEM